MTTTTTDNKTRYIGPSGAVFVPNTDAVTTAGKVAAGHWRLATPAEVAAFLASH